jgi:hypothetical protein
MVKNISIAVLLVLTILFGVFGYIQKIEADAQREIAVQQKLEAEMQKKLAEQTMVQAQYAHQEAELQRRMAEEARAECLKNKR